MKAALGRCRGREWSQKGSPPARCRIDPVESDTVAAHKLSSPVIWGTWRQRGRGGSLRPVACSWLHSGLHGSRHAGGGALQVAGAKSSRRAGLRFLTPAVSLCLWFSLRRGHLSSFPSPPSRTLGALYLGAGVGGGRGRRCHLENWRGSVWLPRSAPMPPAPGWGSGQRGDE